MKTSQDLLRKEALEHAQALGEVTARVVEVNWSSEDRDGGVSKALGRLSVRYGLLNWGLFSLEGRVIAEFDQNRSEDKPFPWSTYFRKTVARRKKMVMLEDHLAIAKDLFYLNIKKWPLFIGLAIFIGVVSILFSHHIVGPAYRFRKTLENLNERNLSSGIHFRKWDYFHDIQTELNRHIRCLREDVQNISEHHKKAMFLCGKQNTSEIEQELAAIGQILKGYKTENKE